VVHAVTAGVPLAKPPGSIALDQANHQACKFMAAASRASVIVWSLKCVAPRWAA